MKKCKTIDDVIGRNDSVQRLIKDVLENILEVERGEHWSYVNILDTKSQTFLCYTSS